MGAISTDYRELGLKIGFFRLWFDAFEELLSILGTHRLRRRLNLRSRLIVEPMLKLLSFPHCLPPPSDHTLRFGKRKGMEFCDQYAHARKAGGFAGLVRTTVRRQSTSLTNP